jgi:hypothetical protein
MSGTANSIITPQTPKSAMVNVASANTTFSTSATATLLVTAGASGGRLTRLVAVPCETVTASNLQAYRSIDSGTSKYLALRHLRLRHGERHGRPHRG